MTDPFTLIIAAVSILLLCDLAIINLSKNVRLKRKTHLFFTIALVGLWGLSWTLNGGVTLPVALIMLVGLVFIVFQSMKTFQFCDSCGSTVYQYSGMIKTVYCPICKGLMEDPVNRNLSDKVLIQRQLARKCKLRGDYIKSEQHLKAAMELEKENSPDSEPLLLLKHDYVDVLNLSDRQSEAEELQRSFEKRDAKF